MGPDVLYLILCDTVQPDPQTYHRYNVLGLITSIRSVARPPFPVVRPSFRALVLWTGGQGLGELALRIIEQRSGTIIFRTRPRRVRFVGDPTAIGGVIFHIQNCCFPAEGVSWVEVLFTGSVIVRQRLFLKA